MYHYTHGADIYSAAKQSGYTEGEIVDFSANINPYGMPEAVQKAVAEAIPNAHRYPDSNCGTLCEALGRAEQVPTDWLYCANGAAEIIFRLVLCCKPKHALVLAPTFSEYEQALSIVGCIPHTYLLKEETAFEVGEDLLLHITPEMQMVFLCNPNNPTGKLCTVQQMRKIQQRCKEVGAVLVVDECFMAFTAQETQCSIQPHLQEWENTVLLKAFTKVFAMAGLRLGYCITPAQGLIDGMKHCGQPWSVSLLAQQGGIAALQEQGYLTHTLAEIAAQRRYLQQGLERLGMQLFDSQANYIFFKSNSTMLKEKLLKKGFLIRSCANYRGLNTHFYRIAVRTPAENKRFLDALERIVFHSQKDVI